MSLRPVTTKLVSSLAAILILAAGCTDRNPTAVELTSSSIAAAKGPGHGPGKKAKTLSVGEYAAGTYSESIGPMGGRLKFGNGELVFPRGALDREVVIVATTDGSSLSVDFGPEGLTFNEDHLPTLIFDTKGYDGDLGALQILHVDAEGNILEEVPTFADLGGHKVGGPIGHFSAYALVAD